MSRVETEFFIFLQASLALSALSMPAWAHEGHGDSGFDFTADGMSCRWIGGVGQGLECEGADGNGMSTSCALRPDLCQSGQIEKPRKEAPTPQPKPQAPAQSSPNQPAAALNHPSQKPGTFQSLDGMTCELLPEGGLECGKYAPDGAPIEGFSTTCDIRPDLCALAPKNAPESKKDESGGSAAPKSLPQPTPISESPAESSPQVNPGLNSGLAKPPLPSLPSTNKEIPTPQEVLGENQNGKGGNVLSSDFWSNFSAAELQQTSAKVGQMINAAKTGASAGLVTLQKIRQLVKHALFHNISRGQVFKRLPMRYYADNGLFEKPKETKSYLDLVADTTHDALVRDVSVGEECLGLAPGAATVQHVDMMAQCAQAPFGERRRFKF